MADLWCYPRSRRSLHGSPRAAMSTGGIPVETAGDYLWNGAVAVGVGGGLYPEDALVNGRYDEITTRAERLLTAFRE